MRTFAVAGWQGDAATVMPGLTPAPIAAEAVLPSNPPCGDGPAAKSADDSSAWIFGADRTERLRSAAIVQIFALFDLVIRRCTMDLSQVFGRALARHFRRFDSVYWYRKDLAGAPIEVTADERNAFVRAFGQLVMIHAAAFAVCALAAWMFAARLRPHVGEDAATTLVTLLCLAIAFLLYVSLRRARHAPARALAGRPKVGPPDPGALGVGYRYRHVVLGMVAAFLYAALTSGDSQPLSIAIGMAVLPVGLFLAARKWRRERHMTPAQRAEAVREPTPPPASRGGCLALIAFALAEAVVFFGTLFVAAQLALLFFGAPGPVPDDETLGLGLLVGLIPACILTGRVDRLCKRVTGTSVLDALGSLPVFP